MHYDTLLIKIISLMTSKSIRITHANHSVTSKATLRKMHVQPERLYFLFAYGARHYPG